MAQPSSREGLIDYAKRQLGFPVLEINVADEQFQDLLDVGHPDFRTLFGNNDPQGPSSQIDTSMWKILLYAYSPC